MRIWTRGILRARESYFFDHFLNTRIDTGMESNEGYDLILELGRNDDWHEQNWATTKKNDLKYDEDVNQYIILTLAELANPQVLPLINKYLVSLQSDIGQEAVSFDDSAQEVSGLQDQRGFPVAQSGFIQFRFQPVGRCLFRQGRDLLLFRRIQFEDN